MRGSAGRRKRGSWWGMQLRSAVPDMADSRGRVVGFSMRTEKKRQMAGPKRTGKLASRC